MEPNAASVPADLQRLLTHTEWLRSLARRLVRDASAAEDLVQETFLAAMKSPPDPDRPVRPWLAGVVRRLAAMRARSEGRRSRRQAVAARKDSLPSTAELIEGVDTQQRLAATVLELAEPYRTTVLLRYYQDLSAAEIARRQGVPAGTVRWRLKRGLEEMRGRLDKSYNDRSAWCTALISMVRTGAVGKGAAAASTTSWLSSLPLWQIGATALLAVAGGFGIHALVATESEADFAAGLELEGTAISEPLAPLTPGPGPESLTEIGIETEEREEVAALAPDPERSSSILVLDGIGDPAAGLTAVWVDATGSGEALETDVDGRLWLSGGIARGTLFVERTAAFIHRIEVEFEDEEPTVRFPAEAVFSGQVLIDGQAPGEQIELQLDYDQEIYGKPLPRTVEEHLGTGRRCDALSDRQGRFQFLVPQNWSGELWFPDGLVVDADWKTKLDGTRTHIAAPMEGFVAHLKRLPTITGRVLEADGETPVPTPDVLVRIVWADGKVREHPAESDVDGDFRLILPRSDARSIRLEIGAERMRGQRTLQFGREKIEAGLALGDVLLAGASEIEFEVTDSGGEPIAGAAARIVGTRSVSLETDDTGLGVLELPLDASASSVRVSFGAPGYRDVEREVVSGSKRTSVQLEEATRLDLVVTDRSGAPLPEAKVRVLLGAPLFDGRQSMKPGPWSIDVLGGGWVSAREYETGGKGVANFVTDDFGRLNLQDITPFVPFELRVLDVTGTIMHEQEIAPLSEGEQRSLTVTTAKQTNTLRGIVRDDAGSILVGVIVEIRAGDRRRARDRSGRSGEFTFERVSTPTLTIELDKRGYAPRILRDVVLPPEGDVLEFQLVRGREVIVLALDENGRQVPGGAVTASAGERSWQGTELEPGRHVIKDLPNEEVEIALAVGSARYTKVHDARNARVEFGLPIHGQARVRWNLSEGGAAVGTYRLRFVRLGEASGNELVRELEPAGDRSGEESLESLLPGSYDVHFEARVGYGPTTSWVSATSGSATILAGEETRIEL
ncbi:MAG: sigma-70 family RNA polymerase sigma factor [bacterium]|nr:sigma-70 family RNA polymerase sigma factor [bacterium]